MKKKFFLHSLISVDISGAEKKKKKKKKKEKKKKKKKKKKEVSANLYHVDFKLVTFRFAQIKLRNQRTDKHFQEILDFILTFCGKGLGVCMWKEYE